MEAEDFIAKFRERVEQFLAEHDLTGYVLGKGACNDGSFVEDLLAGREPRLSTIRKVEKYMADFKPSKIKPSQSSNRAA